MARVLRGDVVWADLNPVHGHEQAGIRPVLVISHEVFNQRSGTINISHLAMCHLKQILKCHSESGMQRSLCSHLSKTPEESL